MKGEYMTYSKYFYAIIFISFIIGILFSYNEVSIPKDFFISSLFFDCLKFIMFPLISITIIRALCSQDIYNSSILLGKSILSILCCIGISILCVSFVFYLLPFHYSITSNEVIEIADKQLSIFPKNISDLVNNGNIFNITIFSIVTGLILSSIKLRIPNIIKLIEELNTVLFSCLSYILYILPISVGYLLISIISNNTLMLDEHLSLIIYILSISLFVSGIYLCIFFMIIRSGLSVLKNFLSIIITSCITCSSNAVLPLNIKFGNKFTSNSLCEFFLPLCIVFNKAGVVIYLSCICFAISPELSYLNLLTISSILSIFAFGASGIPGGGVVMLGLCISFFNLPLDILSVLIIIDRIFDMIRTSVNNISSLTSLSILVKINEQRINMVH